MAKDGPRISVCIANYNGGDCIVDCLNSVLTQVGDIAVEIIVHDDASTDGSAELVERQFPGVLLIRSQENIGFCVSNNRMVAAANGDYVLLLNNDAMLLRDALMTLLNEAEALERPAVLGLPQYDAEGGELLDMGCFLDIFLNPIANRNPARNEVGLIMGACLWMPRALWSELGGFPEWFGSIAEDLEICLLAKLWGYPVRVVPRSGYRHWVGKSFGGGKAGMQGLVTTYRRRRLSERNKTFTMIITFPAPWFYLLFPLHIALLLLEGACLSLIKRDCRLWREVYFDSLTALFEHRPLLRTARRKAQIKKTAAGVRAYLAVCRWWPHKLALLLRYGVPAVR